MDILDEAGISKPDIGILSDEFLETVKSSPYKNLQLELLKKLINDEIRSVSRKNVVQSRRFSEMLKQTLNAYQNRTVDSVAIILELIDLARIVRDQPKRGAELGLTEDEMAFYDIIP